MDNATCLAPTGCPLTRYQEKPEYAEGLYELGQGCYAWLVPNGSWGEANAGLIVGEGESLLVDTLWDEDFTRQMLDSMATVTQGAPLRYTVNTHADGDHFWGNALVAETEIITSQASLEEMTTVKPQSMLMLARIGALFGLLGRLPGLGHLADSGHWMRQMVAPYNFGDVRPTLPSLSFNGQMTLTVGGQTVELIEVGPLHTAGDLMVYVPEAGVLYAGDVLFIGSTPVMWAGPLDNWLAALDRILDMDVQTIVPGHGPLCTKDDVRQVYAYWEWMDERIRGHHAAGLPAHQAATQIALSQEFAASPFAEWLSPERIMVSTHTHYRHLNGQAKPPSIPQLVNILRRQGALAHRMDDVRPAVMTRR